LTLDQPVVTRKIGFVETGSCVLSIDDATRELNCFNGSNFLTIDLVGQKVNRDKTAMMKSVTKRSYKNLEKSVTWNGRAIWISRSCDQSLQPAGCIFGDEFNPKENYYVINPFLLAHDTAEIVDLFLYNEKVKPSMCF